jgi:glycosyltransferase involved in cell wall biosynthesis
MPWLPAAVRAPLLQLGLVAEVIVVDDWSDDGSSEWLDALALALGPALATVERTGEAPRASENLAVVIPRRATNATPSFGAQTSPSAGGRVPHASADEVASEILAGASRCYLRVLSNNGSGQGAALQTALDAARAPLIAHNEADDEYGPHRLERMRAALLADPQADAVFSAVKLTGTNVTAGMGAYVEWQNELLCADDLAAGRFVELPSLHQTGLYRRASLDASAALAPNAIEGGRALVYRELSAWPVDYDFTLRWFALGHRAFKLPAGAGECVYSWRQHGSNGTRWQGRCSLEALRACKAHYLARGLREASLPARVQLWSTGRTLEGWASALKAEGVEAVEPFEWNPKAPAPKQLKVAERAAHGGRACVRLFVYGKASVRARVRTALGAEFDGRLDFFAA